MLISSTPPRRQTGMRRRSKKARKQDSARRKCVAEVRERDGDGCFACCCDDCTGIGTDPHELVRRGQCGSIVDAKNVRLVCRPCHRWIGLHPKLANKLRLHIWSWEVREGDDEWPLLGRKA